MTTQYRYTESARMELVLTSRAERNFPWHTHIRHWTLGVVCSGTAELGTREGRRILSRHDSFIIAPNEAHTLRVTPETTLAVLCLDLDHKSGEGIDALLENLPSPENGIVLPEGVAAVNLSRLRVMALRLAEHLSDSRPAAMTPFVQAVMGLLQQKPEESLSLEYLASLAGYSRWHFLRLFQKETGLTPHAYQCACRVRLLRSLLRADTGMATAAVSAGFSDQSHMHKVFTRYHGLTPQQFKRACFKLAP